MPVTEATPGTGDEAGTGATTGSRTTDAGRVLLVFSEFRLLRNVVITNPTKPMEFVS